MEIVYSYAKKRKNFGAQTMFCESPIQLLDSIEPSAIEQKPYILRNPVHQLSQASTNYSEHYVNTKRVVFVDRGANHAEGGWPKDVNFFDEEATIRHRRRIERDDTYIDAVLNTYKKFEHCIKQNNAIELYEMYFKGMRNEKQVETSQVRIINIYNDPHNRPVASIDWTYDEDTKLAVAYCDKRYPFLGPLGPFNRNNVCYIWEIENPYVPYIELTPPTACWQLICAPGSPPTLLGGLEDGRVCMFDIRAQRDPVFISETHLAHRWPISSLLFMQSRLNNEFFSASSDGRCMWWDTRNISEPTDTMIISCRPPPGETMSMSNAEPVSCIQFDRNLPTKFLCGTDTGLVVNVNRKGKTFNEMMTSVFYAHNGPVRSLHRSPCLTKVFITCGDWCINIWSDDCNTSPIITGQKQKYALSDVVWAPQRYSGFMSVSADGVFRYYDLLRTYRDPVVSLNISRNKLLKIKPHEDGKLVANGDIKGAVILIGLSDNLVVSTGQDKQLMGQSFERELKREHILETRIKEIRLKLMAEDVAPPPVDDYDEAAGLIAAEDEYRKIVTEEIKRAGVTSSGVKEAKMRKR